VVIPAYNAEEYVAAALESVIAQTYRNYEVILVDDGSQDRTPEIARAYLDRIRYIRQDNKGEAAARNAGVVEAAGELIAFLDADDLWLPEKLELQVAHLDTHPEHGLVFSDLIRFNEHGVLDLGVTRSVHGTLPDGNMLPWLFRDSLIGSITVLVRRECFARVGLFDETLPIGCDYDMWLRIAGLYHIGYIDQSLAMYRQHGSNATRNEILGYECQLRVLWSVLERHPELREELGAAAIRRRLAMPSFALGRQHLLSGDSRNARRHLAGALKSWPLKPRYWVFFFATFLSAEQRELVRAVRPSWRGVNGRSQ
jgi:glycosyltransferase involved in cell wall biosynthesis